MRDGRMGRQGDKKSRGARTLSFRAKRGISWRGARVEGACAGRVERPAPRPRAADHLVLWPPGPAAPALGARRAGTDLLVLPTHGAHPHPAPPLCHCRGAGALSFRAKRGISLGPGGRFPARAGLAVLGRGRRPGRLGAVERGPPGHLAGLAHPSTPPFPPRKRGGWVHAYKSDVAADFLPPASGGGGSTPTSRTSPPTSSPPLAGGVGGVTGWSSRTPSPCSRTKTSRAASSTRWPARPTCPSSGICTHRRMRRRMPGLPLASGRSSRSPASTACRCRPGPPLAWTASCG